MACSSGEQSRQGLLPAAGAALVVDGLLEVLNGLPLESKGDVVETKSLEFVVPEEFAGGGGESEKVALGTGVNCAITDEDRDVLAGGGGHEAVLQACAPEFDTGGGIDSADVTVAADEKVLLHAWIEAEKARSDDEKIKPHCLILLTGSQARGVKGNRAAGTGRGAPTPPRAPLQGSLRSAD